MNKAPTTLIIMDGFGLTDPGPGNAVSLAQTPQLTGFSPNMPTPPCPPAAWTWVCPPGRWATAR